jgi:rRNA maturation protein Rpf1
METSDRTVVLSSDLHAFLATRAEQERKSISELVREACARQYGFASVEERLRAVRELAAMNLPVGTVEEMKRESVRYPDDPPS